MDLNPTQRLTIIDNRANEADLRQRSLEEKRRQARKDARAEINRQIALRKLEVNGNGPPKPSTQGKEREIDQVMESAGPHGFPDALFPNRDSNTIRQTMSAPGGLSDSSTNPRSAPTRPPPLPPTTQSAPATTLPRIPNIAPSRNEVFNTQINSNSLYQPPPQSSHTTSPIFRLATHPSKATEDFLMSKNPYRNGTSIRHYQGHETYGLVRSPAG
jgi:hypothetical protein